MACQFLTQTKLASYVGGTPTPTARPGRAEIIQRKTVGSKVVQSPIERDALSVPHWNPNHSGGRIPIACRQKLTMQQKAGMQQSLKSQERQMPAVAEKH